MGAGAQIHAAHQSHWWRLVALVTRYSGDAGLAEDAVSGAFEQAVKTWPRDGVPDAVFAWLATAARNKAIDAIRARSSRQDREAALVRLGAVPVTSGGVGLDDEIHLMALCAHPVLSETSAVCAMLRFVSGVPTDQIAAIFGVSTSTMAARLTRAKKSLAQHSDDLYDLPAADLVERVPAVRGALYVAWTLAHTQVTGKLLRDRGLAEAVLRLVRVVAEWDAGDESAALAALCEFGAARWCTREFSRGGVVEQHTLEHAPRDRWNWALVDQATSRLKPTSSGSGVFRWRAEIDRLLCSRSWAETDWAMVLVAHDQVLLRSAELSTALSRVVALSYVKGPERGLVDLAELLAEPAAEWLLTYPYSFAAEAHFLVRLGRVDAAVVAYARAAEFARTEAERQFFTERVNDLTDR